MTVGSGFPRLAAQTGQGGTDGAGCMVPMPIQTWRWEPHSPGALLLSLVEGRPGNRETAREFSNPRSHATLSPGPRSLFTCSGAYARAGPALRPCPTCSPCSVTEGGLVSGFPL